MPQWEVASGWKLRKGQQDTFPEAEMSKCKSSCTLVPFSNSRSLTGWCKTTRSWLLAPCGPDKTHPARSHLYFERMEVRMWVQMRSCLFWCHIFTFLHLSTWFIEFYSSSVRKSFCKSITRWLGCCRWLTAFAGSAKIQQDSFKLSASLGTSCSLCSQMLCVFTISPPHGASVKAADTYAVSHLFSHLHNLLLHR